MKKIIIFSFLMLGLIACESKFYKKFETIEKHQWNRKNILKYEVDIQETTAKYKIIAAFRYSPIVNQSVLKIKLNLISPSAKTETSEIEIPVKDTAGNQLGEAMGDIADIQKVIQENYTFAEKGKYTFEITQNMTPEEVGGIYEVGLIVEK